MTSVKRDLSSRARFNQLQWINLEGSGPFKRNGKNMVVYALAAIAGVVAIFVVFGVKTSVRGISNLVTDPPSTQWFPSAVDDPNADITPVPDLSPEMTRVVHVHDPNTDVDCIRNTVLIQYSNTYGVAPTSGSFVVELNTPAYIYEDK